MEKLKNNNFVKELLVGLIDVEEINKNQLLLIKKDKKILLKDTNNSLKDLCYEVLGKTLNLYKNSNEKKNSIKIFWEEWEINFLKENYKIKNSFEICNTLKKSPYQINYMMSKLNLFSIKKWSDEDLEFLKENLDKSTVWLAQKFNRSVASVKAKKRVLRVLSR